MDLQAILRLTMTSELLYSVTVDKNKLMTGVDYTGSGIYASHSLARV